MALVELSAAKDNDSQTVVWSAIHYERVRNLKEKKGGDIPTVGYPLFPC